jgi:alanine-synthesizing transaminase
VVIAGGKPIYYPCRPEAGFVPDPDEVASLVGPRCKALVLINPNNPTGAVYPRAVVEGLVRVAEQRRLAIFSDEIYDRVLYGDAVHTPVATLCEHTLCATFGGLSKVYRACGFRTGWVFFSGRRDHATEYLNCLEMLASLRLCASVPGQWAVQTALGGVQSIYDLTAPNGRLGRQRQALIDAVARSPYLSLVPPRGALYAFVRARTDVLPQFVDTEFAMRLLEEKHVLVVPGSSFNVDYTDHFRVTLLPDEETINTVFGRMDALLAEL